MVELKRGPKAYTYGCFVKALEMYADDNDTNNNDGDSGINVNNDMEDFLNSCEEDSAIDGMFIDGDDNDDQFTSLYNTADENIELHERGSSDDIAMEMKKLDSFIIAIKSAREKFSLPGNELSEALKDRKSCEYFSALLIMSEMQTLDLYELASMLVRRKLEAKSRPEHTRDDCEDFSSSFEPKYGKEQGQKVKDYAVELADAFLSIRYAM